MAASLKWVWGAFGGPRCPAGVIHGGKIPGVDHAARIEVVTIITSHGFVEPVNSFLFVTGPHDSNDGLEVGQILSDCRNLLPDIRTRHFAQGHQDLCARRLADFSNGGGFQQGIYGVDDPGRLTPPQDIVCLGKVGKEIGDDIPGSDSQVMKEVCGARHLGQEIPISHLHGIGEVFP